MMSESYYDRFFRKDNKAFRFGNTPASPDATIQSDGTDLRIERGAGGATAKMFLAAPLRVGINPDTSAEIAEYHQFGPTSTHRAWSDGQDCLAVHRTTRATDTGVRSLAVAVTSDTVVGGLTSRVNALNAFHDYSAASGSTNDIGCGRYIFVARTGANGQTIAKVNSVEASIEAQNTATATITAARCYLAAFDGRDATFTALSGLHVQANIDDGACTDAYGVYVEAATVGGTGGITNHYGLYVAESTAPTNQYGVWLDGQSNAIHFNAAGNKIYSGAANRLTLEATTIYLNGVPEYTDSVVVGATTLATIGKINTGGPVTAAQAGWAKIKIGGADAWVPYWT